MYTYIHNSTFWETNKFMFRQPKKPHIFGQDADDGLEVGVEEANYSVEQMADGLNNMGSPWVNSMWENCFVFLHEQMITQHDLDMCYVLALFTKNKANYRTFPSDVELSCWFFFGFHCFQFWFRQISQKKQSPVWWYRKIEVDIQYSCYIILYHHFLVTVSRFFPATSCEVGFTYKGPEPTSFGDWAHKGRAPGLNRCWKMWRKPSSKQHGWWYKHLKSRDQ